MPHGESWFSRLFADFYESVRAALAGVLSLDGQGNSWVEHVPIQVHHVFAWVLVLLVVLGLALYTRAKIKDPEAALVPDARFGVRNIMELLVESTYGMMVSMMGKKAAKHFLPLIGTCAVMILFSNLLGMLPGFTPPTEAIQTTAACAIVIFFVTHWYGVKEHGLGYFKHFFGPIIKWYALPLMLLIFLIEMVSHLVRPVTLAVRLAANMNADHKVLSTFLGLIYVPLPLYLLGCIVVVVQTLVFCLLSTVYISMAIAHEEH